ncbi:MAG: SRPBCC family protein [Gammaproteobacteria bacterium]
MNDRVMFEATHSVQSAARCGTVYEIWTDVQRWPEWDLALVKCDIEGEFKVGAKLQITPQNAPNPVDAIITELEENALFTDEASMPFGKVSFSHELRAEQNGCVITHTIRAFVEKEQAVFFGENIFSNMEKGLAPSVEALAQMADKKEALKRHTESLQSA